MEFMTVQGDRLRADKEKQGGKEKQSGEDKEKQGGKAAKRGADQKRQRDITPELDIHKQSKKQRNKD